MRLALFTLLLAGTVMAQTDGEALLKEGLHADALEAFKTQHRVDGATYASFMGLGRSRYGLHDLEGAIADFERARELDPRSGEPSAWIGKALEGLAEVALQKGDDVWRENLRDAAVSYVRAAGLVGEEDAFGYHVLAAECSFRHGDGEAAVAAAERAFALRPEDVGARRLRARCLFGAARYDDYLKALESLDVDDDLDFQCTRFIALTRSGQIDEALRIFNLMLMKGWGSETRPFLVLSKEWATKALLPRQVKLLERHVVDGRSGPLTHYYYGLALGRSGQFEKGAAALGRYLALDPGAINALCDHSQLSLLAEDLPTAHRSAREAITLSPGYGPARTRVDAVVAAYVGGRNYAAALELHEVLVVAAPEDPDVARNHAALLKDSGRLDDAALRLESLCRSADVELERGGAYWNDYGLCLMGLGRSEEAEAAFRKAFEVWPFQLDARENLGVLKYEQGQLAEAEQHFEEVLRLHGEEAAPSAGPRYRSRYYLRKTRAAARNR